MNFQLVSYGGASSSRNVSFSFVPGSEMKKPLHKKQVESS